ncbi:MAG: hypothetical protein IKR26_04500 [Lachnospiraceae bacterium]|nr:hypothetical protein [Lachnospiraceae bacterium]
MVTIKIPDYSQPNWSCEIDGIRYSYPAGSTQEVPDAVAAVINNYKAMQPQTAPDEVRTQRELTKLLAAAVEKITALEAAVSPLPAKVSALEASMGEVVDIRTISAAITSAEGEGIEVTANADYDDVDGWVEDGKPILLKAQIAYDAEDDSMIALCLFPTETAGLGEYTFAGTTANNVPCTLTISADGITATYGDDEGGAEE